MLLQQLRAILLAHILRSGIAGPTIEPVICGNIYMHSERFMLHVG